MEFPHALSKRLHLGARVDQGPTHRVTIQSLIPSLLQAGSNLHQLFTGTDDLPLLVGTATLADVLCKVPHASRASLLFCREGGGVSPGKLLLPPLLYTVTHACSPQGGGREIRDHLMPLYSPAETNRTTHDLAPNEQTIGSRSPSVNSKGATLDMKIKIGPVLLFVARRAILNLCLPPNWNPGKNTKN